MAGSELVPLPLEPLVVESHSDPADGSSRVDIDKPVIGGQVGDAVGHARGDESHVVRVRTVDGLEQGQLPSPRQLVLDRLGDESAPVALDPVDALDEIGIQVTVTRAVPAMMRAA